MKLKLGIRLNIGKIEIPNIIVVEIKTNLGFRETKLPIRCHTPFLFALLILE